MSVFSFHVFTYIFHCKGLFIYLIMDLMYASYIYLIYQCTCMANTDTCSQIKETEHSINIKKHGAWMNKAHVEPSFFNR